jgi:2-methylcitrate dehydratase PrpD
MEEALAMFEPTISGQLGAFLARLSYRDLSQSQVSKLKIYFLDWLGSAIAGKGEKPVQIILDVIRDLGGTPESTIIASQSYGNCLLAALANGASSHVVEMDDLHRESILHPAAAIIPAVFALAEREKASGADLLLAIAVGYEAAIRVALGVGPSHYRFWHTTATCGTFGAAAGAARLLGLDEEQTIAAYGYAGRRSMGVFDEQCHEQTVAYGEGGSQWVAFGPFGPEGVHGRAQDPGRGKRIFQSHFQRFRRGQVPGQTGQRILFRTQFHQIPCLVRPYAFRH